MTAPVQTTHLPAQRKPAGLASVVACETCGANLKRGRNGPPPRWCPTCRAERNRVAAIARRRATKAGAKPTRPPVRRGDFQLPAEDHLAMRAARLRIAVNEARVLLREGLESRNVRALALAASSALEVLDALPVGR